MSANAAATGHFAIAALLLVVLTWKIEGGPRLIGRGRDDLQPARPASSCTTCAFRGARADAGGPHRAVRRAEPGSHRRAAVDRRAREHLSLSRWAGIAVALFGALVVISRGDLLRVLTDLGNTFGSGERFMLCAVLSWAAYTVIGRRALDGLSPLAATTYAALWGLALLIVAHLFGSPPATARR